MSAVPPRIVITGAAGLVGQNLVVRLKRRGFSALVAIDKHKIEIKSQIKALGSYPVEIKLHKSVVAKTTVDVVAA